MTESSGADNPPATTPGSGTSRTVVKIFDHQYRIGSASADAEAIQEAAAFLDERMRQIAGTVKRRVPLEVAILAAMEMADEVLRSRNRREQLLSEADERISRFTRKLEDETGATPQLNSEESGSGGLGSGGPGSGDNKSEDGEPDAREADGLADQSQTGPIEGPTPRF